MLPASLVESVSRRSLIASIEMQGLSGSGTLERLQPLVEYYAKPVETWAVRLVQNNQGEYLE